MKLTQDKFKIDENRSNPLRVAMCVDECPINEVCIHLSVGFGNILKQCEHLELDDNKDTPECTYQEIEG